MTRSRNNEIRPGNHNLHNGPNERKRFDTTFFVIVVSLLFVAVLAGALVGGVLSGDPSSGFFLAVIVASGLAVSLAILASAHYCCKQRSVQRRKQQDVRKGVQDENLHPTFTRTIDEDEEAVYYDGSGNYFVGKERVEDEVQTINAKSMAPGDVSAMSPGTYEYDVQSYAETGTQFTRPEYQGLAYHRSALSSDDDSYNGPFDFSSGPSSTRQTVVRREDPPEELGGSRSVNKNSSVSRDPEAAVATADGKVIPANGPSIPCPSPALSQALRFDLDGDEKENVVTVTEEDEAVKKEREQQQIKDWEQRTVAATTSKKVRPSKTTLVPPPPPPPPPPRSTRPSQQVKIAAPKSSTGTPPASEAGSISSSAFLKPFANMFGKKRATGTSEAGGSDASAFAFARGPEVGIKRAENKLPPTANARRPPIPAKKAANENPKRGLDTIGGNAKVDKNVPPSPGQNSIFSIPPPRRVPSTPGGASEVPSEFRSVANSSAYSNGVASSTFDAEAHERALQRVRNSANTLGAAFNDMPIYYDDDESGVASAAYSAAPSVATVEKSIDGIGYDVFAPPGPLGMVVDTIEKGCIVHSLKKNSPMQGLINPGDLIVALDDFDVRKMDAASLTKLMAKKSQQKERKFTLIPNDQA